MNGKRTSLFIREFLKENKEAYIQQMWNGYKKYCIKNGYKPPSRQSFGNYIWMLKKLELIEFVREEKGMKGTVRHYFRINQDKIDDEGWKDPVRAMGLRR